VLVVIFCCGFIRIPEDDKKIAFVVIFCPSIVRTTKDEDESSTHSHLFYKGRRLKKKQNKKKGFTLLWC
jgi:hypothetical protein